MSTTGLHCTNGMLCQMRECTSQFQLCRHDSTFMKKKEDLYEENARLRAEVVSLQKENASLKEDRDAWRNAHAEACRSLTDFASQIEDLTQQLAAANERVEKYQTALEHIAQWSQELQDDAIARGLVLVQWRGCVAYATAALSDLPEAAKEKS